MKCSTNIDVMAILTMLTVEVFECNIIAVSSLMVSLGNRFVGFALHITECNTSIGVQIAQLVDPVTREAKHMIE